MKSITSGQSGQFRGTKGKVDGGLITQRSQVQILPPQPTEKKALSGESEALRAVTKPAHRPRKLLILKQAIGYSAVQCVLGLMDGTEWLAVRCATELSTN
jgi:hypothetical protein